MNPARSVLLTDLYQLTMLQGYHDAGMEDVAVFEFFVRRLRPGRGFLLAAGLDQSLDFLEQLRFTPEDLEWLASTRRFSTGFLASLETLRFGGDVHAMPEGTVFFPNEPILRVTAPIAQAQLVETRLINLLHLQTLIASKAARSVLMAPDKLLVDFGLRRPHGADARNEDDHHPRDQRVVLKDGMRSMNTEERSRFTTEAFGFITKLSSLGIISVEHRDEILDRALSLHSGRIELSHMKSLLVLDLFANDMDHGDMGDTGPDHRGTVWN